jgi:hypothetical protein
MRHVDGAGRCEFDVRVDPCVLEPPANIERLLISIALRFEALPQPEEPRVDESCPLQS